MDIAERISFQSYYEVKPKEINPLSKHIEHFKKNWSQEGLPANWSDLPGTGFMINRQVDLIFSEFKENDSIMLRKEKKEKALNQTDRDIKGFILEYLAEGLVFPINYCIDTDGHLVDRNYGNKKVIDIVSSEERNGSVRRAIGEKIEPFLASSLDGSMAVMDSPSGWSGLHQEDGKAITFLDSQIYIFQKKGSEVVGFAIRTDFTSREHREFIRSLTGESLPENASVVDYIMRPALIDSSNNRFREIKDVARTMQDVRREISSESVLAYKNRAWNEVYRDIERGDELWHYDEVTKKMVQDFKDYVLTHEFSRTDVKEALAATILRIAKFLRHDRKENTLTHTKVVEIPLGREVVFSDFEIDYAGGSTYPQTRPLEKSFGYGRIFTEVQKLPGCAGGGSGTSLVKSITPRFGEESLISERSFGHCEECQENSSDNHYHCPKCEKKYADETDKSQEERTKWCSCGFEFGC
jgi:hypothetical protein